MPPTYRGGTQLDPENVEKLRKRGILFDNDRRVKALERGARVAQWRALSEGVSTPHQRFVRLKRLTDAVVEQYGLEPGVVVEDSPASSLSVEVPIEFAVRRVLDVDLEV